MRRLPLLGCLAVVPLLFLRLISPSDPIPLFPKLILWAWESPQDLRFIKPGSAGIAFLERTVWLDEKNVRSRPRLQPLRFTPGVELMAVVRLESAGHSLPMRGDVVREITPAAKIAGVHALQIDFDARRSERVWYAALLRELREAIPAALPLTITALESWCEKTAGSAACRWRTLHRCSSAWDPKTDGHLQTSPPVFAGPALASRRMNYPLVCR